MELLEEQREFLRPFFARYNGKEIKTIADAFLIEFDSALEAIEVANRGAEIDPVPQMKLQIALVHAKAGQVAQADSALSEVMRQSQDQYVLPGFVGMIKLGIGQKLEGYRWLRRAVQENDPSVLLFGSLPSFSEYRKDPLWLDIDNMIGIEKHVLS